MENVKKERRTGRKWFEGFTMSDVERIVVSVLLTTAGTVSFGCEFGLPGVITAVIVTVLFFGIEGYRDTVKRIILRNKKTEQ